MSEGNTGGAGACHRWNELQAKHAARVCFGSDREPLGKHGDCPKLTNGFSSLYTEYDTLVALGTTVRTACSTTTLMHTIVYLKHTISIGDRMRSQTSRTNKTESTRDGKTDGTAYIVTSENRPTT